MRTTTPIVTTLLLAALAAPGAPAEEIPPFGTGHVGYSWTVGSVSGSCAFPGELVVMTAHQVNSRLVVTIETGTRQEPENLLGATNPFSALPEASCPLQILALPGLYENPCSLLAGQPTPPALDPVDPYFHQASWNPQVWQKTLTFSDGGYVTYYVADDLRSLGGSCAAPGASAELRAYDPHTYPCVAC